jgi:cytochrome c oxidase subunit 4
MSEPTEGATPAATTYFVVFFSLLTLTALTTAVAYIDLGPLNIVAALGFAALKASLVALYFMHLRQSPHLIWLFSSASLLWLLLLIGLTMGDVATRTWILGS